METFIKISNILHTIGSLFILAIKAGGSINE